MSAIPVASSLATPVRARRGGAWAVVGLLFAVVLIVVVAGSFVGSIAYQSIIPTQRVFPGLIHAVEVDVENGAVTIEPTLTGGAAVVSSGVDGLSFPSDVERVTGGALIVRSICPGRFFENHCSRNYVLRVPADVRVFVNTESGDVTARGVGGALVLHSGQGDVTVTGTTGAVDLSSDQGDVSATGLRGPTASARSGQGEVRLAFAAAPRTVSASSAQGDVTIVLPEGPDAYSVSASSSQGVVTDKVAVNPTSRRSVRAVSGQGDVAVSYARR